MCTLLLTCLALGAMDYFLCKKKTEYEEEKEKCGPIMFYKLKHAVCKDKGNGYDAPFYLVETGPRRRKQIAPAPYFQQQQQHPTTPDLTMMMWRLNK